MIEEYARIRGIGASSDELVAHVNRQSVLGLVIQVNSVPLNKKEWNQFKQDVDQLIEKAEAS